MKPALVAAQNSIPLPSAVSPSLLRLVALWQLSKPRVTILVWLSALAAMWLPGKPFSWWVLVATATGVWLVVASANGWNQVLERCHDAQMKRTAQRPIPSGRLSAGEAAAISTLWGVIGVLVLWFFVNPLTAMLGAFALLTYVLAYTPAKRFTAWCTVIGAIPGAIPPVMGWTAVTGQLGTEALFLFLMQFLWQFPHFWAIAWKYRHEYREAGFRMLPFDDQEGILLGRLMLVFAIALVGASLVPALLGWRSALYTAGALILGAWSLHATLMFARQPAPTTALRVILTSVGYLPLWLLWLILVP
ncbi:MAG: protoheme IX farnesyltransferase [Armatimonadota bacterium]|nr:MAG: protoheme IX farnesyltransferase [Armatimonadota bacterium]